MARKRESAAMRTARHVLTLKRLASETSWAKLRELVYELVAEEARKPQPPDPRQVRLFTEEPP